MRSINDYVALELASSDLIIATHAESELLCICLLCRPCTESVACNSGCLLKLPERMLWRLDVSAVLLQQQSACFKCDTSMCVPSKGPLKFHEIRLSIVASTSSAFRSSLLGCESQGTASNCR